MTERTQDPAECADDKCLDDGASESEAGQEQDDAATEPASDQDAGREWPDAASEDATIKEPADAAIHDLKDAALDGSIRAPDSGPRPAACDGSLAACRASEVDHQTEACGNCGRGMRTRTRSCAADGCGWGAWGAWSACTNQNTECDPNAPAQTQTVACTTCGTRTQSRSCSHDTCTWGPWTDASPCSWCEECSEVVYCDTPANIADRGTWCRQKACSREQALSDCKEDVEAACGATTEPFYMQYL